MPKHNNETPKFNGEPILRLLKNNWVLLVVLLIFGVFIAVIAKIIEPRKYIVNGMIQVNNKQPVNMNDYQINGLFGSDDSKILDTTPQSVIAMGMMTSHYILNQVIRDLKLNIKINPKLFPIIGTYSYNQFNENNPSSLNWRFSTILLPLLENYAWGGEHINIKKFLIPQNLQERAFILSVKDGGSYALFYKHKLIMNCTINQLCSNNNMKVSLQVDQLSAHKKTEFILVKHSLDHVYQILSRNLQINEISKSHTITDHTGIINISLTGNQPKLQIKIVNHLMEQFIAKSWQDKIDPLVSMQKYVANKLYETESQVLIAQSAVSKLRESSKIIDLETQAKLLVTSLDDVNRQIAQNTVTHGTLESMYGKKHPLMQSLQRQLQELQQTKHTLLTQVEQLPRQEAKLVILENNLSVQQNLRDTLIKHNQELQILISGQPNSVKILLPASIDEITPQSSNIKLFAIVGGILGVIVGVFLILLFWLLRPITQLYELDDASGVALKMIVPYYYPARNYNANKKAKILTRHDYHKYSHLLRNSCSTTSSELNKMAAEFLLNAEVFKVIGIMSLYKNAGDALIAHNLANELLLSGKKIALIHAGNLQFNEIGIDLLYSDETGELIGNEFTYVEGLTTFILNPDFRLDIYNEHLKKLINKINRYFDFIFVLDSGLKDNISRLINFTICNSRYLVTTQQISKNQLLKDLEYLQCNNIEINGLFFNYNLRYFIHDLYSK